MRGEDHRGGRDQRGGAALADPVEERADLGAGAGGGAADQLLLAGGELGIVDAGGEQDGREGGREIER